MLEELNRLLNQRNRNRIRRVGAIVFDSIRARELARASAQEGIDQQSVAELIAQMIEGRQCFEETGQGVRQDIGAAAAAALANRMPESQNGVAVDLFKAMVSLLVHPVQERAQVREVSNSGPRSLWKPGRQRTCPHGRDQSFAGLSKRIILGIRESAAAG